MKTKISISIDNETLEEIRSTVKEGVFRNTSHFIELAIRYFLKDKGGKNV